MSEGVEEHSTHSLTLALLLERQTQITSLSTTGEWMAILS